MELFRDDGCLTDEGLLALTRSQLDELGRLEAAEHLAYCDCCTDRYTALLTEDCLEQPPQSLRANVRAALWVRVMQNTYGRAAVAAVAAVLALTFWRTGLLTTLMEHSATLPAVLPAVQTVLVPQHDPEPEVLGRPIEPRISLSDALEQLLPGRDTDQTAHATNKKR